jgi:glycosyltransferase involved in cell wall biosynthesis
MRIAFLTPEFVTDYTDGGGLGNYLNRIGKILVQSGHEVEVFASSSLQPRVLVHDGMRVERVWPFARAFWTRMVGRVLITTRMGTYFSLTTRARALAAALERRHREAPFDIVQSADYLAVGLAIRKTNGRVHLVRCSSAAELYNQVDHRNSPDDKQRAELECKAIRRADKAYAPSRLVAKYYRDAHGIPISVVRPPAVLDALPIIEVPVGIPARYLVHFGQLTRRKGTEWLSHALVQVFDSEPEFRMVWIGRGDFSEVASFLEPLGDHRSKVTVLYPLPKPQLYAIVKKSEAAVLPSLVDNLPNTVIESLMLGVPVIGTRGASIDELVEHGVTGKLVPVNDVEALASAIIAVWRGTTTAKKGFQWSGGIAEEMQPDVAVKNFFSFATGKAASAST